MRADIEKPAQGGPFNHVAGQGEHENRLTVESYSTAQKSATVLDNGKLSVARRKVAIALADLSDNERHSVFQNLYPFPENERLPIERQKLAAAMRGRFEIADWIDTICGHYGWRLTGFVMADLTGIWEDNLESVLDLEWLRPGDDDHVVRLVLGDVSQIYLTVDGGGAWQETSLGNLLDALTGWCEGGARND